MAGDVPSDTQKNNLVDQGQCHDRIDCNDRPSGQAASLQPETEVEGEQHDAECGEGHSQRSRSVARIVELLGAEMGVGRQHIGRLLHLELANLAHGVAHLVVLLHDGELGHVVHRLLDEIPRRLVHVERQVVRLAEPRERRRRGRVVGRCHTIGIDAHEAAGMEHLDDGLLFIGRSLVLGLLERLLHPFGREEKPAGEDLFGRVTRVARLAVELGREVVGHGLERTDASVVVGVEVAELVGQRVGQNLQSVGRRARVSHRP